MSDNSTSPLVKWFQRLIDFCLCIDRRNHDQGMLPEVQGLLPETPVPSGDKAPLVDNILNSIAELESISAVYKDICAIAENDASGRTTNTLSTASSAQSLAVNKENGKVILNGKNSSANSKRNESRTTNGLIADKDLLATTSQNGVRQISSSKSPLQPVILNGKPDVLNSTIYDSSKVNESKAKNGLKGEKYLPLASAQNGVSKLRSSSNSSSHLVMLNEESNSVNGKTISNITNGEKSGSQTEKLAVDENCAQTASGQNHVNKVCRYSLKPLNCKIGSLKNTNEKHGQISSDKEKAGSFIKDRAASYIDDIIQNGVSNNGKEKMRTNFNDESKTKNNPNDKNLTAFLENSVEKDFKYSSGSNKIGGIPNQREQIEQILRCFEKSKAMKDDIKVENKISLDNNKLRLKRLGLNYTRSVSLQSPETDQLPTASVNSQQNVDKVENKEATNSQTTSSTCGKHSIKRLSLPNIFSGCAFVAAQESENVKLHSPSLKTLEVPIKSYRVMSFPDLRCGGTVVFSELSKHISLPNIYDKDPIVYMVPCTNLNFPPILPSDDLKVERERVTGGGLIKEDDSKKICLPDLISEDRSLEDFRASSGYGSMSGGGLVNTPDTDHAFSADIHSSTVACVQLSSLREFMNTENSSAGDPRPISDSYISDFLNRERDTDESRRNSSTN